MKNREKKHKLFSLTEAFPRVLFIALFCMITTLVYAQNKTVTGHIADASGEPVIGASVLVKGTTNGTISDFDGNFSLTNVADKATLQITFIGYTPQDISVAGKSKLNIVLQEDSETLEEVVVVGYGIQKKESVVGSISSINNKTLVSLPVTNLTQSLAGKLSGVQVVQASGEVGRDEADVYVRGMATYGDAKPLIVVDGVMRSSFAQIDPNEIQSINILKDASATAVYGIKGANGVIVVTTRRGVQGKPTVSFSAQVALTEPTRIPNPLGSYEASALRNLHKNGSAQGPEYSALDIIKYRTEASPYTHPNVNWVDEIMKDQSTQQQYNLNISGGTERLKYFVSGGFMTQDGFYKKDPYTNFTRYNFRSNFDINVTKDFTVSLNLGARVEELDNPASAWYGSWDIYRAAFATSGRKTPVYNPDGSLAGPAAGSNLVGKIRDSGQFKEIKSVMEMGVNLRYKLDFITKGLGVRAQVAYDNDGKNRRMWQSQYAVYDYNIEKDQYTQYGENRPLSWQWENQEFSHKIYAEAGLDYTRTFGPNTVSGLLLFNRNLNITNADFEYADQGLVGRLTYDYDHRYFAEFNIGVNGSENFPKGKQYGTFPAFAVGWMLSNEKFYQNLGIDKVMSLFKLRASLGWVGNDKLKINNVAQRFLYLQRFENNGGVQFGTGDVWFPGIYKDKIANFDVSWEVARKMNLGIETDFWNGLFGVNVDVFTETRSDILTDIGGIVPNYVGAAFMPANVGIVDNKGFEIELKHNLKINDNFSYYVKGNLSYAKNKVVKRADAEGLLPYQKEEGYSIGTPLLYKSLGVFQSYQDIYNSPTQLTLPGNTVVYPGDQKYLDFNNDGIIDQSDAYRQLYGEVPEIQYGVTVGGNYRGFDFSILFQGSERATFGKNWEIMWHFSNNDNVFEKHWKYWSPEISGEEEYIRLYGAYLNNEPGGGGTTYAMGSGDYIRIKNVEVGYTFPTKWVKKIFMTGARVFVTANNLCLWADEPYLDPDNRNNRGGNMPPTRAFNFGVNVNF